MIFFIIFAVSMISAVVATTKYPPQLVQKDYYNLDIHYQERLDGKQNAAALPVAPQVQYQVDKKSIKVQLPEGVVAQSGNVKCYRATSTGTDVNTPLNQTSQVDIPAADMPAGRWHVELEWKSADGKPYYWETTIVLNS